MQMRSLMWAAMVAATCGLPWTQHAWAQQEALIAPPSEAMTDKARELYAEGRELYAAGKFEPARASFLAAWSLKRHWQIAGMLGFCELEMDRPLDAAGHLTLAVRTGAGSAEATELGRLREALSRARARVGAARVLHVDAPGAELLANGVVVATAPFEDPVFFPPGTHVLQARAGVKLSSTVRVSMAAGREVEVALRLDDGAGPSGMSGDPGAAQPESPPSLVPAIVGGSIAAVGLGVGVGFLLSATGKESDRDDAVVALGGSSACGFGTPHVQRCAAIKELSDDAGSHRTVATVGFSVFGAALLGTAAYWFWPWRHEANPGTAAVVPVLGPEAAGVQLAGSF
ncbi:MAG: hypothetical protein MUF54_11290 [Polyangiaceae bacterium]|nr:hypothetical protein [Polyangiaceae bacterium]